MSKDPKTNHWWPPQKMPLEYWVTDSGSFLGGFSQGSIRGMNKEQVIKLAEDAETLAKELREAAALMKG